MPHSDDLTQPSDNQQPEPTPKPRRTRRATAAPDEVTMAAGEATPAPAKAPRKRATTRKTAEAEAAPATPARSRARRIVSPPAVASETVEHEPISVPVAQPESPAPQAAADEAANPEAGASREPKQYRFRTPRGQQPRHVMEPFLNQVVAEDLENLARRGEAAEQHQGGDQLPAPAENNHQQGEQPPRQQGNPRQQPQRHGGQRPYQPGRSSGLPYNPHARAPQQRPSPPPFDPQAPLPGQQGYPPYGQQYDPYAPQRPSGRQQGRQPYPQRGQQQWQQERNQPNRRGQVGPGRGTQQGGRNQPGRNQQRQPHGYGATAPVQDRYGQRTPVIPANAPQIDVRGIVWLGGGRGLTSAELLDERTLTRIARIDPNHARNWGLRSGDLASGQAYEDRTGVKIVTQIEAVNGSPLEAAAERRQFEQMTATFPDRRIKLEQGPRPMSSRVIDLFAPLGFGSRALIVAPPKTGKTTLIREAAESVLQGYPDAVVMAVLVGERPEEVTDLRLRLEPSGGHVYAASFDEDSERHAWLVQVAVERAKRVAEQGKDAFMVLDSLTRLARAENLATRSQGRTLSGGIDAQALDTGRRAFGAARNLEEGGSITILATCLVETGSRQDDVVYEEFKGTGNMELHLSRELSQRRIFPAVDVIKSGTRREEMLLSPEELRAATLLRRRLADLPVFQATEQLLKALERYPANAGVVEALTVANTTR